ncbi:MAG: CDP-diacylglycerol--glycerol-3-phosphate 3-phosphatidyltransferase [Planctomycetes bacterium]|nr:CDP-diacylglycerol--glycerol-3-phosphate 3-phosphatidyltransferase [Planctomycetota bacterium]
MASGVFAHWPNRITAIRFAGAVALFVLLARVGDATAEELAARRGEIHACLWLFVAVALSDILDGWLARRGNHITAFGRIADPFVDKVLVMGAMIYLAVLPWSREFFPAWIVVVVLSREFLVTGIRGYVESLGHAFPADWFGKVKMLMQCWAIGIPVGMQAFDLSEVARERWALAGHMFVWLTLLTSVGSGLSYVFKARKFLSGDAR